MPLLEAFLALALTLLSLAMIATLIVELIHRLARTRAKNLKMMLGEYYDSELKTMVETELKKSGKALEEHKKEFINTLITNPLIKEGRQAGPIKSRLIDFAGLSTEDLFKGLVHTDIGKQIKAKAEAEIDEAEDSLSQSYDALGVAATDLFKRKAQITSLWVGVLVAFALNANALLIFKSYLDDPQARAKAVAQADAALDNFTRRTDIPEGFENKEELAAHVDSIKTEINELADMGITIGYSADSVPVSWSNDSSRVKRWSGIVFWALGVFATGLLIGLGGPFWFNVVRKLTDVLQVARGQTPSAAEPGDSAGAPANPMKSNRDTFKMTGASPPSVKAQANLTAATKAATDADRAVIATADALMGTRKAAGNNPSEPMKTAIAHAEEALKMATDTQKKAYQNKHVVEQSKTNVESKCPKPANG